MNARLGPLDADGRVPPRQQTRVAAFLLSAHGALARHFSVALAARPRAAWQGELNAQFHREAEIVALLFQATSWLPDLELAFRVPLWEAAWLLRPVPGMTDRLQGSIVDLAALGHAVHAVIRPAVLLPEQARPTDGFVQALRRIEFESGRLIQAQIVFLKSAEFIPFRDLIEAAVERRHAAVRKLWHDTLASVGVHIDELK